MNTTAWQVLMVYLFIAAYLAMWYFLPPIVQRRRLSLRKLLFITAVAALAAWSFAEVIKK